MRVFRSSVVFSYLAGLLTLVATHPLAADSPSRPRVKISRMVKLKTTDGTTIRAQRGNLTVPENRSNPDSGSIDLVFIRLHSEAKNPAAPLVYLTGGPGGSCSKDANNPAALQRWAELLAVGDVILLDQRATGSSTPDLVYVWDGRFPKNFFRDEESARAHWMAFSSKIRRALKDSGVDINGYTTVESADDLDDLRRALELDRISLLGFSYGTHLGLATLRRHGEHIENAVFSGVAGPNHLLRHPSRMDTCFRRLAHFASKDPRISSKIPDLTDLLQRVLQKLDRDPMIVEVVDPRSDETIELPVGGFGLSWLLAMDIGDASDVLVFPRLLWTIDRGDASLLQWFVRKRVPICLRANAMTMIMRTASNGTAERRARILTEAKTSLFGNAMNFPFFDVEGIEPLDLGDDFRAPVTSSVRTLFLSGDLDFNTPPFQAEHTRWGFADSVHLVVENAGHEQVLLHPEIRKAMVDFLAGKDVRNTRAFYPPIEFVPLEGLSATVSHPSLAAK